MPENKGIDEDDLDKTPLDKPRGKTFYLFIGIDYYLNEFTEAEDFKPFKNLSNPVLDICKVTQCLNNYYEFPKVTERRLSEYDDRYTGKELTFLDSETDKLKCFFNEKATKSNIIKWLKELETGKQIGKDDSLFIYFSGHGVYDEKYYLIPCKGDRNDSTTWLALDEIYSRFSKYTKKSICRDLLIVLDCCYSGAAELGFSGSKEKEMFSRYVLTSSNDDEKANDGWPGNGSPFAASFIQVLEDNKQSRLTIREIETDLSKKLKRKSEAMDLEQTLNYGSIPNSENGIGEFDFFSNKQDRPQENALASSLVKDLNFSKQKTEVDDYFHADKAHFLATVGSCSDSQKLLLKCVSKYIFQNLVEHQNHIAIKIEPSNLGIPFEKILYKNISGDPAKYDSYYSKIAENLLQKISGYSGAKDELKHIFIWIGIKSANQSYFDNLQKSINQVLLEIEKKIIGKRHNWGNLFFIVSDERENAPKNAFDLISHQNLALINTPPISSLRKNDVRKWRLKNNELIGMNKLHEDAFFLNDPDLPIIDFIRDAADSLGYIDQEKMKLYSLIYDFKDKLH